MTLALWRMVQSEDPEPKPDQGAFDLGMVSLNSTRGVLAGTAMSLYCRWLELDKPIPRLLPPLLRRFASDPVLGVRVSILNRLPFLVHRDPELGWALFGDTFREQQGVLWVEAEGLLYYNYRHSFDRVGPLLARISNEAPEVAGETYGRIATLSYLADHLVTDEPRFLALATNDPIRQGIAQVLAANLGNRSTAVKCRATLVEMLQDPECSTAAVAALGRKMGFVQVVGEELWALSAGRLEGMRKTGCSGRGARRDAVLDRNGPGSARNSQRG
jgi:hypothetical protein